MPFLLRPPDVPELLPADAPRLRLHFTLPVLPSSVTADAFVLRLRDEEAVVILRRTEVFRGQTVVNGYPVHLIRSGAGEWQVLDY